MALIRGGPAGPSTEDAAGYKNLAEDDRAALWQALGARQGILSGFEHSLAVGQLGHVFEPGSALVEERDTAGNLGTGRGYHLYASEPTTVLHNTPSAGSRNDAVVFAFVDIEDGPIGTAVAQSGPQIVVIQGTSGVTTPVPDSTITAALGRGGWLRYADVIIAPTDTSVQAANVTQNLNPFAVNGAIWSVHSASTASIPNAAWTEVVSFTWASASTTPANFFGPYANGVITFNVPGLYHVTASATFSSGSGGRRLLKINKNGVEFRRVVGAIPVAAADWTGEVNFYVRVAAGDTLGMYVWQDSGASLALGGGAGHDWQIVKVSD